MRNQKVDVDRVKNLSVGRWPGIYSSLGISVGDGRHTACPICGGTDRFRMDDKGGRGTWICNQCGAGDGWALVQHVLGMDFMSTAHQVSGIVGAAPVSSVPKDEKIVNPDVLRKMFTDSQPATDCNRVGKYLQKRGLTVVPISLRYHPGCYETETKKKQPAMLAVFSLPDGTAVTMHRTFLGINGKLDVEKPKKMMPTLQKMTGGAVRLFPLGKDGDLAITEGIETAIAFYEDMGIPTWAALSAGLLEKFEPPKGVKRIVVCGDNDRNYSGQKAAFNLANRIAIKSKIPVEVHIPIKPGFDWLDVLTKQKKIKINVETIVENGTDTPPVDQSKGSRGYSNNRDKTPDSGNHSVDRGVPVDRGDVLIENLMAQE